MDGSMSKRSKIKPEVMDWAVAVAGMMYAAYQLRQCAWMAEKAVGEVALKSRKQGVGSIFGEALSRVQGAAPSNMRGELLAGNHLAARAAVDLKLALPKRDDVYEEARNRGVVPADWTPPEDFPVLFR